MTNNRKDNTGEYYEEILNTDTQDRAKSYLYKKQDVKHINSQESLSHTPAGLGELNVSLTKQKEKHKQVPTTRIAATLSLGGHFGGYVIDIEANTAVIFEPIAKGGYVKQLNNIQATIQGVFPTMDITRSKVKIQSDSYSCGRLAPKIINYLCDTESSLRNLYDNLPQKRFDIPANNNKAKKLLDEEQKSGVKEFKQFRQDYHDTLNAWIAQFIHNEPQKLAAKRIIDMLVDIYGDNLQYRFLQIMQDENKNKHLITAFQTALQDSMKAAMALSKSDGRRAVTAQAADAMSSPYLTLLGIDAPAIAKTNTVTSKPNVVIPQVSSPTDQLTDSKSNVPLKNSNNSNGSTAAPVIQNTASPAAIPSVAPAAVAPAAAVPVPPKAAVPVAPAAAAPAAVAPVPPKAAVPVPPAAPAAAAPAAAAPAAVAPVDQQVAAQAEQKKRSDEDLKWARIRYKQDYENGILASERPQFERYLGGGNYEPIELFDKAAPAPAGVACQLEQDIAPNLKNLMPDGTYVYALDRNYVYKVHERTISLESGDKFSSISNLFGPVFNNKKHCEALVAICKGQSQRAVKLDWDNINTMNAKDIRETLEIFAKNGIEVKAGENLEKWLGIKGLDGDDIKRDVKKIDNKTAMDRQREFNPLIEATAKAREEWMTPTLDAEKNLKAVETMNGQVKFGNETEPDINKTFMDSLNKKSDDSIETDSPAHLKEKLDNIKTALDAIEDRRKQLEAAAKRLDTQYDKLSNQDDDASTSSAKLKIINNLLTDKEYIEPRNKLVKAAISEYEELGVGRHILEAEYKKVKAEITKKDPIENETRKKIEDLGKGLDNLAEKLFHSKVSDQAFEKRFDDLKNNTPQRRGPGGP